jgi:hypothetical protein
MPISDTRTGSAYRAETQFALHAAQSGELFMLNPWFSIMCKTVQLGVEAQSVIALRMMRLAAGGAAASTEANRMIAEKVAAGIETQAVVASGLVSGHRDTVVAGKVLRGVKKRVRANKRRLSRR